MAEPGRPSWLNSKREDGFTWANWYPLVETRAKATIASAFAERSTSRHPWALNDWQNIAAAVNRVMVLFYQMVRHGGANDSPPALDALPSLTVSIEYSGGTRYEFPFNVQDKAEIRGAPRVTVAVPCGSCEDGTELTVTVRFNWKADFHPQLARKGGDHSESEIDESFREPSFSNFVKVELQRQLEIPLDLTSLAPRTGSVEPAEIDELWDLRVKISDFLRRFLKCFAAGNDGALHPFLVFLLSPHGLECPEIARRQHVLSGMFGYRYVLDGGQEQFLSTLSLPSGRDPVAVLRENYVSFPHGQCSRVFLAGRAAKPFPAEIHSKASPEPLEEVETQILRDSTLMELPVYGTYRMWRPNAPDGPELILCVCLQNPSEAISSSRHPIWSAIEVPEVLAPPPNSNYGPGEAQLVREFGQKLVIRHTAPGMALTVGQSMVYSSRVMQELQAEAVLAAASGFTVLIQGDTGTGKELVAQAIHDRSSRRARPFVIADCGSSPDELVNSYLFGHKKGSFTGAIAERKGKFEEAHRGTIFLDEIGKMPLEAQRKLLRAIGEGLIEPLGADKPSRVDVRVIAASNKDLATLVADGLFLEDLLYRLNTVVLNIPPLAERREDVPLLARHFLAMYSEGKTKRFTQEAIRWMTDDYPWPGNVRQLQSLVKRAIAMCPSIDIEDSWLRANADKVYRNLQSTMGAS